MTTWRMVAEKMSSVRAIIAVVALLAMVFAMDFGLWVFLRNPMTPPESVKEIVMLLLMAVSNVLTAAVTLYFSRTDRSATPPDSTPTPDAKGQTP